MNDGVRRVRRPGRPSGTGNTRSEILAAARAAFASTGFDGTSVHAVAARAGVNPSTVLHFFGTKDGLFRAVINDVAPASRPFVDALQSGACGQELAEIYLRLWDSEESGPAIRALTRAAFGSEHAAILVREALVYDIVRTAAVGPLDAEIALTHLIGIAIGRHIARLSQLARADVTTIAARVGPILDAYLQMPPPASAPTCKTQASRAWVTMGHPAWCGCHRAGRAVLATGKVVTRAGSG